MVICVDVDCKSDYKSQGKVKVVINLQETKI